MLPILAIVTKKLQLRNHDYKKITEPYIRQITAENINTV